MIWSGLHGVTAVLAGGCGAYLLWNRRMLAARPRRGTGPLLTGTYYAMLGLLFVAVGVLQAAWCIASV